MRNALSLPPPGNTGGAGCVDRHGEGVYDSGSRSGDAASSRRDPWICVTVPSGSTRTTASLPRITSSGAAVAQVDAARGDRESPHERVQGGLAAFSFAFVSAGRTSARSRKSVRAAASFGKAPDTARFKLDPTPRSDDPVKGGTRATRPRRRTLLRLITACRWDGRSMQTADGGRGEVGGRRRHRVRDSCRRTQCGWLDNADGAATDSNTGPQW
jgi:hypothetical protein